MQSSLTEQEAKANKTLLEVASARDWDAEKRTIADKDAEIRILLADIAALEKVVQKQTALRRELQTRVDASTRQHQQQLAVFRESSEQTWGQLRSEHQIETKKLLKRIADAEQLGRERANWLSDNLIENRRLRKVLLRTETLVDNRDGELRDLQLQLDTERQAANDELTETQNQHSAESRYLQAIASRAESQKLQQKETIQRLESQLMDARNTHLEENQALRDAYESKLAKRADDLHGATCQITSLSAEVQSLQRRLQRTREERDEQLRQAQRVAEEKEEISKLQAALKNSDQEFRSLFNESQQTIRELERTRGSLERLQLKNERLVEIRDSEFTSLGTQIDELVVALSDEQSKRTSAENEARRLSVDRSQRISFLGRQNKQSLMQLGRLREERGRLLEERSELGSALDSAEAALTDACGLLNAKTREIQQLRSEVERAEDQVRQWQQRLQREAAAWRKAEGAIKRQFKSAGVDKAARDASSRIKARDQIALLKGQIKSLQKVNLLQQRRSTAEILSYEHEVAQLKRRLADRAA